MKKAMWIWHSSGVSLKPEYVVFRKKISIVNLPETYEILVCADSRYNLYVNGKIVARGPARNKAQERYHDIVNIAPFFKKGVNVIFAQVIHFSETPLTRNTFSGGPVSIETSPIGGFLLSDNGNLELSTDESWECCLDEGYLFERNSYDELAYMGYCEKRIFGICPDQYSENNLEMKNAVCIYDSERYRMGGLVNIWMTSPRPIPFPYEEEKRFERLLIYPEQWKQSLATLIKGTGSVTIPPNSCISFVADPEEYVTAFPYIRVVEGKGAEIQIQFTEKFTAEHLDYYKENGKFLDSTFDTYYCDGVGREIIPFFYRAFRYLALSITTGEYPLKITGLGYYKTGYPIKVEGDFYSSNECDRRIWEISRRTLECCMYETYMDCPYYEQMQYTMDTMLQTVFTYQISRDDRLARKAIDDYYRSQLYDGMIPCNAPSGFVQIIPGFSAFWIFMLYEHYRYHGDKVFISNYLPGVEKLLNFYIRHIQSDNGLIGNTGFWQFVDWVKGWQNGCPTVEENNYIYSMIFSYAFQKAANLFQAVGNDYWEKICLENSEKLNNAINMHCRSENGLYIDAPNKKTYSQHAQIWAVLCGCCTGNEAKIIMKKALEEDLEKVSYSMSFFLFRALEMTGLYSESEKLWEQWKSLAENGSTTWPEDPISRRSECHAWGALALYEHAACFLGVQPLKPGYEDIVVQPLALWLESCEGVVTTCKGNIRVSWNKQNENFAIEIALPKRMNVQLLLPDGNKKVFKDIEFIKDYCRLQ